MARKKEMCSLKSNEPGVDIVLMKLDELHSFEGHPYALPFSDILMCLLTRGGLGSGNVFAAGKCMEKFSFCDSVIFIKSCFINNYRHMYNIYPKFFGDILVIPLFVSVMMAVFIVLLS